MLLESEVLAAFPAEIPIPATTVADALAASSAGTPRVLVVLDDDPTGTQSVGRPAGAHPLGGRRLHLGVRPHSRKASLSLPSTC